MMELQDFYLIGIKKNIFEKIHYGLNFDRSILIKNITNKKSKLSWDNFVEKLLNNI